MQRSAHLVHALFKLLLSQVSQALEVSKVLIFKGHIGFQGLLQKAGPHKTIPMGTVCQHICFTSRKAQPLGAWLLQRQCLCSSNTQN